MGVQMISHQLRRMTWRLGRKLYCWARKDLNNNPASNGEYWLLNKVIQDCKSHVLLFDVGANIGDWSEQALYLADRAGRPASIYAFEPCTATRRILSDKLAQFGGVEIFGIALSSNCRESILWPPKRSTIPSRDPS